MSTEHQKQTAFLRSLIHHSGTGEGRQFLDRMDEAQRHEKCLGRAVLLVAVIGLLACSGLGYAAVLRPEFAAGRPSLMLTGFGVFALGSLLCLVAFTGFWLWLRGASHRLHKEVRDDVMRSLTGKRHATPAAD